jgi:YidC/Oxa1 family membrane protein insertase
MEEQRRIAPELAALRKRYKGDAQKQQQEMMKLYREHGINPLRQFMGCVPAVLQLPILTALYYVFLGNARQKVFPSAHFLFVPNLNDNPGAHPLIPGLPIPTLVYLIIPLLAAVTTFVQSKMIQQPPNPLATEQEQQTQQMTQSMQVLMPLMIAYFAIVTPAGLGLYWFVSNCVAIIQQYLVTGWGALRPAGGSPPPPLPGTSTGGQSGPKPRRPKK